MTAAAAILTDNDDAIVLIGRPSTHFYTAFDSFTYFDSAFLPVEYPYTSHDRGLRVDQWMLIGCGAILSRSVCWSAIFTGLLTKKMEAKIIICILYAQGSN